jgi:hypothetical protein
LKEVANVDEIEDAKSREFQKRQQSSTGAGMFLKQSMLKMRDFSRRPNPPWAQVRYLLAYL